MALDVNKVRTTVDGIYRKNQAGGYLTTAQFNNLAEKVQLDWYRSKLVQLGATRLISKDLQDIKVQSFIPASTVARVGAQASLPSDYWEQGSVSVAFGYTKDGVQKTGRAPATEMDDMEFDAVVYSEAFAPTKEYPVYKMTNGTITLLPDDIQEIGLVYFKYPDAPAWVAVSPIVNNREQYSSVNSTQFTVPEDAFDDIVDMILFELGVSTRDGLVIQTSAQDGK